jgi:hypothetical protein
MLAELIQSTSLVIWDEALMTHRGAFEALDRTFRDIQAQACPEAATIPFGAKVVVLGGYLRQILPVIEGGTPAQVINSAIVNSPLWRHVAVLNLTINMRLSSSGLDPAAQQELQAFSHWILDVGEGVVESVAKEGETEPSWIKTPHDLLLMPTEDKLSCIVDAVYPDLQSMYSEIAYLRERAILTPTNDLAETINEHIASLLSHEEREYLSCDKTGKPPSTHDAYDLLYPVEFLNSLNGNNFPRHKLVLKLGVPIMLVQNLSQSDGLCNGTRLIITALGDMVIQAKIMTGNRAGQSVLIPRISLTLKNTRWPFVLHRRQFPIKICYAMTINKSQGHENGEIARMKPGILFSNKCFLLYRILTHLRIQL